jgi:Nucleotide modification associated domain 2
MAEHAIRAHLSAIRVDRSKWRLPSIPTSSVTIAPLRLTHSMGFQRSRLASPASERRRKSVIGWSALAVVTGRFAELDFWFTRCVSPRWRILSIIPLTRGSGINSRCGAEVASKAAATTFIFGRKRDGWLQRDSFHSNDDGTLNQRHVNRDTGVNRVLISTDFVYFGGEGPSIPPQFRDYAGFDICQKGVGRKKVVDEDLIVEFVAWLSSLGDFGYRGMPTEWKLADG